MEEDAPSKAFDHLFPILYEKMKKMATSHLDREYNAITIEPTELVHELYLKLVDQSRITANSRKHFYGIASHCMRQILVDHARKKKAGKRGGNNFEVTLHPEEISINEYEDNLLAIDEVLDKLRKIDERAATVVEMKFFSGMSIGQIADILEVSEKTVKRDWQKAKLWIYTSLKK